MKTKLILIALLVAGTLSAETLMTFKTREPSVLAGDTSIVAGNGAYSTLHANLEASSLVFGEGTDGVNTTSNQFVTAGINSTTLAAAMIANEYLSFTVDAQSGYQASLESVDLRLTFQNGHSDFAWALFSSATGFGENQQLAGNTGVAGASSVTVTNIDLSGEAALQDVTGEIEFRLVLAAPNQWVYAGVSDNSLSTWPYDPAIQINGTVTEDTGGGGDPNPDIIITSNEVQTVTVYKIVVDTPDGADLSTYYPISSSNLVDGPWADVAHADNSYGPYVITNLAYSAAVPGGISFYVKVEMANEFFGIEVR